jgi:hypothetical protein
MPKYAPLIYAPTDGEPAPEDPAARVPRWREYNKRLLDARVVGASEQLYRVEAATTVRERDHQSQIINGPATSSEEFLAGYYVLDCADLDEALEYARAVPLIDYGSVEIRPVLQRSESLAPELPQAAPA